MIHMFLIMSEKISVNVGVFDVRPSVADDYNIPIGLSMVQSREGVDEISILLARQGHHDYIYDAYLTSLLSEQRSCMPQSYIEIVDAIGFFNTRVVPSQPEVYFVRESDEISPKAELAARALFVALNSHTYILQKDDGVMRKKIIDQDVLDAAIIHKPRKCNDSVI